MDQQLQISGPTLRPELRLFGARGGTETHFVLVQPIRARGLVEGVLVVDIALDLASYLPPGSYIDGPVLASATALSPPAEPVE